MKTRTLTLRLKEFRLSADEQFTASFANGYGALRVYADTIRLCGAIVWPGCSVEMVCREMLAETDAAIDVSGASAEPHFDPQAQDPSLNGTPNAPDGKPGADGGKGNPGGTIRIVCDKIEGRLAFRARGSDGGTGRRGGNGVTPKQPDGLDAVFIKKKGKDPEKSQWGGKVLHKRSATAWYAAWASGQPGGNARHGGNAGRSGRGGAGGEGGTIELVVGNGKHDSVSLETSGGAPGESGAPASPAGPSKSGVGGRNRICCIHKNAFLKDIVKNRFAEDGDSDIQWYKKKYKIANRAPSGSASGKTGSAAPEPKPAEHGKDGRTVLAIAVTPETDADIPLELLELVERCAEQRAEGNDLDSARERLRWLDRRTRARAVSDDRIAALRERILAAPALKVP